MTPKSLSLPALAGLAAALASWACSLGAGPASTPILRTPEIAAPSPAPTSTLEVVLPATYPLSVTGPWLVYRTPEAVFIANPDGSGRQLLFDGPTLAYDFDALASPSGALLALVGFDDPDSQSGPWLKVLRLPVGGEVFSTHLLSPSIEAALAAGAGGGSAEADAATAVTLPGALAWSPDGTRLAFVAAIDGPSSDLYLYDVAADRLRRLSSGPNQVASLSWSPDGLWIAHQAVEGFGTGAGWKMGSVWTVSPDGRRLNKLYTPASGGEVFVGWSRGDSLISYSFSADGYRDLRASGAEGAVENILVESYFDDAAYDPESGTAAYAVSSLAGAGAEPGAYLWSAVPRGSSQVDGREWDSVQWSAGRFYFEGREGVLAVSPRGDMDHLAVVGRVAASPDGRTLAVWGDGFAGRDPGLGLYTTGLQLVRMLEAGEVASVSWRPDSAGLMAITEAGLIYYPLEGQPILVDPEVAAPDGNLGWALP